MTDSVDKALICSIFKFPWLNTLTRSLSTELGSSEHGQSRVAVKPAPACHHLSLSQVRNPETSLQQAKINKIFNARCWWSHREMEALVPIGHWWHLLKQTLYTPGPITLVSEAEQQKCRPRPLCSTGVHKRSQQHRWITKDPDTSQERRDRHGPGTHPMGQLTALEFCHVISRMTRPPWVSRPIQVTLGGTSWGSYTHILFVNIFWAHILWTSICVSIHN